MKKKTLLITSLLIMSAVMLSACQPVTPISSEPVDEVAPVLPSTPASNSAGESYGKETNNSVGEEYQSQSNRNSGKQGGHSENSNEMENQLPNPEIGEISQAESDGLAFMREEEKLARDVYLVLYDQWGLRPFSNIASSEQAHTDAVKELLEMYGIADPVTDDTIGVFTNEDLQALNDQLVEMGSLSLEDALKVGVAIEEIDILDLIEYMEETEDPNIEWVYDFLLVGSENHLRVFVSQLESLTGETYIPQYMTQEVYDAIISTSFGRGGKGGRGNN